jgi:ppGpp synthetase/RelA/SpoT-type nucleotidyltranferase
MSKLNILAQFDDFSKIAGEFSESMKSLVTMLIKAADIVPHSISCRTKDRDSLARKIESKSKYTDLAEITDVVGIRIISLYADDVDKIAEVIESEFNVDEVNSIDKRAILDPDRFGYLSLHYVVSLNDKRSSLKEHSKFKGVKFEIQIRSVLQHTWAEIEHDIGYKSRIEAPKSVRRQFSRLAGLLELADIEFENIRNQLVSYEKEVAATIYDKPETIEIDNISLLELFNKSEYVKSLDRKIIELANISHLKEASSDSISYDIEFAEFFKIKSISDLLNLLEENEDNILIRANDADAEQSSSYSGISVFYLSHVLLAKLEKHEERVRFVTHVSLCETILGYLDKLSKKIV